MMNKSGQGCIADTLTGGGRWLQMVADNTMHLPPRQTPDTQRVRSYFKGAVADLQIK